MRKTLSIVALFFVTMALSAAAEAQEISLEPVATDTTGAAPTAAPASCDDLLADGNPDLALQPCRDELAADPESVELQRKVAFLEFSAGDPKRSAELWRGILESQGWERQTARSLAMASWRAGDTEEAEEILRDVLERSPDEVAYRDLIGYLMSYERPEEAVEVGRAAIQAHPASCQAFEDLGVAEAALDHDDKAAELIAKAVDMGCPPFAWTGRGVLPQRLENPAYVGLLAPAKLVAGLDELSDEECRDRLSLLKPYMNLESAPAVTKVVLERRTAEVRFAGLGLLVRLGGRALPYWEQILSTDDFILEKHALRRVREMGDAAFAPLLEARLKAQQTPGNRALTQLTLGEILIKAGETERAEELLRSVPEEHALYPIALMALANWKEMSGDPEAALELIDKATEASPELYVDPERIRRLRGDEEPVKDPDEAPAPAESLKKSGQLD